MKNKLVISIAAVAAFVAGPALAADLPPKSPPPPAYKAPPPVAEFNWSGFYIGVNGGYGWSTQRTYNFTVDNPTGPKINGGFGGGQIGYNWQMNNFVLGAEADFEGSGIRGSVLDVNFGDTMQTKVDYFGTVRGRAGLAFSTALVYVTGGFAYGHVNTSVSGPALIGSPYNLDRISTGYTLGGGFEYAFTPAWSVKGEYQYVDLGKNDPVNAAGVRFTALAPPTTNVNRTAFNTVRIGLNYRFGGRY
jgi:outer membrane immunogenic protein